MKDKLSYHGFIAVCMWAIFMVFYFLTKDTGCFILTIITSILIGIINAINNDYPKWYKLYWGIFFTIASTLILLDIPYLPLMLLYFNMFIKPDKER